MAKGKTNIFESIVTNAAKVLDTISCILVLLLMFLGFADVAGRYFFNHPISGVKEIDLLLVLAIVVLSLAYTQAENRHITVDVIVSRFSPRAKRVQRLLMLTISLALFITIIWQGTRQAITYWQTGRLILFLEIPLAPIQIMILLGAFLLCLQFIVQIISLVHGTRRGN
jgi:TRAP-type transport system small permease protein